MVFAQYQLYLIGAKSFSINTTRAYSLPAEDHENFGMKAAIPRGSDEGGRVSGSDRRSNPKRFTHDSNLHRFARVCLRAPTGVRVNDKDWALTLT